MILSPHELAWLAVRVGGWVGDDARTAVAVALAESGGNTDALGRSPNGQRDHGLWQISGRWWGPLLEQYRWRDPFDNARMARIIHDTQGWAAWAVYTAGTFEQFLGDADYGLAAPVEPIHPHTAWRRRR